MTDYRQLEKDLRWICRSWWRDLNGVDKNGKEDRDKADRKSRAELRRVGSEAGDEGDKIDLISAYSVARFHALDRRVIEKAGPLVRADGIALAAVALAHVEDDLDDEDKDKKLRETARLLGERRSRDSKEPLFAEARFKRLIRTDEPAELFAQMIRAVKILGKKAPVGELGASLLLWGPSVKKRWAFAYWQRELIPADPADKTTPLNPQLKVLP